MNPWKEQEARNEIENDGATFTYAPHGWQFILRHKGPAVIRWQQAAAKVRMSPRFKALADKQGSPGYIPTEEDMKLDRLLTVEMFVDGVVAGWIDVTDEKGKKLPFSRENAIKVFSHFPALFAEANDFANNRDNFKPTDSHVEGDDPDVQLGNSRRTSGSMSGIAGTA